jgi:hypothetical protein
MNTQCRVSLFSRLAFAVVAATLTLGAQRPAAAQYLFYPNNASVSPSASSDYAIVGFSDFNNYYDRVHGTSPTVTFGAGTKLNSIEAYNSSNVTINGATVSGSGVFACDSSTVTVNGGTISEGITWSNGTLIINAGTVVPGGVWAQYGGKILIYGGTIGSTSVYGSDSFAQGTGNTLTVAGGAFPTGELWACAGATLNMEGGKIEIHKIGSIIYITSVPTLSATLINAHAVFTYLESTTGNWSEYQLSGTFSDGSNATGIKVYIANDGTSFNVENLHF